MAGDAKPPRPATYADLEALPETIVGEIVGGVLYANPRPAPRHAVASSVLGGDLNGPFQRGRGGPGGWWILDEPELHLGEDVVIPDLAGWRRERVPELPKQAWFELAPDWLCEVLSPSTTTLDRGSKLPLYARARVGHVWLLDPLARTLEVLRRGDDGLWILLAVHTGEAVVRAAPFEAIEIELKGLWGE